MRTISTLLLLGVLVMSAFAQHPNANGLDPQDKTPSPAPAPKTVKAKYEGGVFGYTKTMEGTLTFDDDNMRLLFKDKKGTKEISIRYEEITSAFGDTQKRRPAAATVVSRIPVIFTLPAHFIKTKVRYLTLQYSDPDSHASGVTSFKLENKDVLAAVLKTLADKADMTQRGDLYVKKKNNYSSKVLHSPFPR